MRRRRNSQQTGSARRTGGMSEAWFVAAGAPWSPADARNGVDAAGKYPEAGSPSLLVSYERPREYFGPRPNPPLGAVLWPANPQRRLLGCRERPRVIRIKKRISLAAMRCDTLHRCGTDVSIRTPIRG
jgi:hypothetical protein